MGCLTRTLLILALVGLIAGAIASRFLPWYEALLLGLSPFLLIGTFALLLFATLRGFASGFRDKVGPQKKTLRLKAGEPFRGEAVAFTFPVACEIQQMGAMGMEFVGAKLRVDGADKDLPAMIAAANCMTADDMRARLEPVFERATAHPDAQTGAWEPTEQLGMTGQRREIRSVKNGRHLRAEMVLLGEDKFVLAWMAGAREEAFEPVVQQVRTIAASVERLSAAS